MNRTNWIKTLLPLAGVCVLMCLSATPGFCWDKVGHEIATQIAYDHLTPMAKAKVDAILSNMAADPLVQGLPDDMKPFNFVTAGAWMDDIRSETREFNTWHYIDLPTNPNITAADVAAFKDDNSSNNYLVITTKCLPTMKDPKATDADQARMLAFFLHLAADLHQPLHANGRQKGGNGYDIDPLPAADPDWHITNLHSFWDNAYRYGVEDGKVVVEITTLDKPRIMHPGDDPIGKIAKDIESKYSPLDPAQASDPDPADWAVESDKIASTFVYQSGDPTTLSTSYVQQSHDIACQRLALAGYRIAAVLNAIYGK